MSEVLYRKYRSKNFKEIFGQEHIVSILTESVLTSNVSHGYLFCGPRGTGKTSLARLLAKAVNCEKFGELKDVCNECTYCNMINNGETMDIIEMDAASNRGIEEIRSMRDTVNYMPTSLKKKVYIIDEAHMLTKEAFNALLKTLEEPPEHVIFILATTEPHKLPITVLSRVQRYDLNLASEKDLTEKIKSIISQENREIDNKSLEIIYNKSGGSFRDAESILGKVLSSTSNKKITEKDLYNSLGILEENLVDGFIKVLKDKDVDNAILKLRELFSKTGSVNNIIDQSLEQLRMKMLKKDKVDRDIFNLANFFINLKRDLKEFNDKMTLMEVELINFCSSNLNQSPKVQLSTQKDIAEDKKKAQNSSVIKAEGGDIENFINYISTNSKETFPRLNSLLESCKISVKDNVLFIQNHHKINLIYLERTDVKDYLTQASTKFFKADVIKFSVRKESKKDKEAKVDNLKEENIEMKAEEIVNKEPEKKVKKEQLDNSSLVEDIL